MDIQQTSNNIKSGFVDFINSNSLVAKISFLLFVLFVFIILLQISITLLSWMFLPSSSPHLITGMIDAKQMLIIPQDPSVVGAKTINRSINATDGIEFTWSIWIFINDVGPAGHKYHHIFHKGDDMTGDNGLISSNNAPGLYLNPNTNALTVLMNTYDVINEEVIIPDVPMNKWINVIIRVKNRDLDVYINGTIVKSIQLLGVPKQNYGPVYVAMNGGFSGYISNLWYYNYAMGASAIQSLVQKGPNTTMSGNSSMNLKNPDYLSLRWYFSNATEYPINDQFN
jgi:hypothetical protein